MKITTDFLLSVNNSDFSLLYETYFKKLCAYGITIGFCEQLCKDAIHDVFYTLCHSNKKMDHVENIEPYLFHCLKNRLFDIYKERKRISCISCDNLIVEAEEDSIGKMIEEENEMFIKMEVQRLLSKLKPNQRKVIYCRFQHNLKFDDIARIMDMSPCAVKKLLYRSLKSMRQQVELSSAVNSFYM